MKIVKVSVKAVLSVAAGIFLARGNIFHGMLIAALCYVLLTYYIWFMKRRGFKFSVFVGEGGLVATLLSFGFMVISPIIPLVIIMMILDELKIPEAVTTVFSVLMLFAAVGFVIIDIGRAFNPDFLKRKFVSDSTNEQ